MAEQSASLSAVGETAAPMEVEPTAADKGPPVLKTEQAVETVQPIVSQPEVSLEQAATATITDAPTPGVLGGVPQPESDAKSNDIAVEPTATLKAHGAPGSTEEPAGDTPEPAADPCSAAAPPVPLERLKPIVIVESRGTVRLLGEELAETCAACAKEIAEAPDFDAKFLVFDSWLRIFDGEPRLDPKPTPSPEATTDAASTAATTATAAIGAPDTIMKVDETAVPEPTQAANTEAPSAQAPDAEMKTAEGVQETSSSSVAEVSATEAQEEVSAAPTPPPAKRAAVEIEVKRFAKYKRLKEALKLYNERFKEDAFESLIPNIISLAATYSGDHEPHPPEIDDSGSVACLSAREVRIVLASIFLLNTRGVGDLQKLYLSSAKAAPQKILCLLSFFHSTCKDTADDTRVLSFERRFAKADEVPIPFETNANEPGGDEGGLRATASFFPDFRTALQSAHAALLVLTDAKCFGRISDVKTPTEEVPLWEFPELLAFRMIMGPAALGDAEVFLARRVRQVNRCITDGPLLRLAEELDPIGVLDFAALDITRHTDDQRFGLEALQRDAAKWCAAMRHLGKSTLAAARPPLLGVDGHWAFLMQLVTASCIGDAVTLRYAVSNDNNYTTGSPVATELSPGQSKEAKHFEALSGLMRRKGWTPRDALGLLALYPFGRSAESERFHAFWTRRLRDKSDAGGRPSSEELASLSGRQSELLPPPPPEPEPPASVAADHTAEAVKPDAADALGSGGSELAVAGTGSVGASADSGSKAETRTSDGKPVNRWRRHQRSRSGGRREARHENHDRRSSGHDAHERRSSGQSHGAARSRSRRRR